MIDSIATSKLEFCRDSSDLIEGEYVEICTLEDALNMFPGTINTAFRGFGRAGVFVGEEPFKLSSAIIALINDDGIADTINTVRVRYTLLKHHV